MSLSPVLTSLTNASSPVAWSQILTTGAPAPRYGGLMAYDAADSYVILYGGTATGTYGANLVDTWSYSHGAWRDITDSAGPTPTLYSRGASMAYDSQTREILLVGTNSSNSSQEQTWAFQSGHWRELTPVMEPTPRWYAAFAYDPTGGYALLYGGLSSTSAVDAWLCDTWEFRVGNWTKIGPGCAVGDNETSEEMTFDPVDGYVVMVSSGSLQTGSSTWAFARGGWVKVSAGGPPVIGSQEMVYDPGLSTVVAIDAGAYWNNQTSTLWEFKNGSWSSPQIQGYITETTGSPMVFDSNDGYPICFSATQPLNITGPTFVSETYKLDFTPVGPPPTVTISVSTSNLQRGTNLTIVGAVNGAYGYVWYQLHTPIPGCPSWGNTQTLSCNPNSSGSFPITFTIVDQAGRTESASTEVTVLPPSITSTWPGELILPIGLVVGIASAIAVGVFRTRKG